MIRNPAPAPKYPDIKADRHCRHKHRKHPRPVNPARLHGCAPTSDAQATAKPARSAQRLPPPPAATTAPGAETSSAAYAAARSPRKSRRSAPRPHRNRHPQIPPHVLPVRCNRSQLPRPRAPPYSSHSPAPAKHSSPESPETAKTIPRPPPHSTHRQMNAATVSHSRMPINVSRDLRNSDHLLYLSAAFATCRLRGKKVKLPTIGFSFRSDESRRVCPTAPPPFSNRISKRRLSNDRTAELIRQPPKFFKDIISTPLLDRAPWIYSRRP